MDMDTLEKQIKAKAAEVVQGRIENFRVAVLTAAETLFSGSTSTIWPSRTPCKEALLILAGERNRKDWPNVLWRVEEEAIREEILSTMDTLQQVLLAKEPEGPAEDQPARPEPAKATPIP